MQVSKNFKITEFVQIDTYAMYGAARSAQFIDGRLIDIVQYLRDSLGVPLTINDWCRGGKYNESGLRSPGDEHYSSQSQHTFGRAVDLKSSELSTQVLYNKIAERFEQLNNLGATTLEGIRHTPSWVHLDCRYLGGQELTKFRVVGPGKTRK